MSSINLSNRNYALPPSNKYWKLARNTVKVTTGIFLVGLTYLLYYYRPPKPPSPQEMTSEPKYETNLEHHLENELGLEFLFGNKNTNRDDWLTGFQGIATVAQRFDNFKAQMGLVESIRLDERAGAGGSVLSNHMELYADLNHYSLVHELAHIKMNHVDQKILYDLWDAGHTSHYKGLSGINSTSTDLLRLKVHNRYATSETKENIAEHQVLVYALTDPNLSLKPDNFEGHPVWILATNRENYLFPQNFNEHKRRFNLLEEYGFISSRENQLASGILDTLCPSDQSTPANSLKPQQH